MTSLALSFNEVKFNPVIQCDGQIWLSSSELAQALDYKSVKSVSNLYNSNKDEFSDSMTQVIESVTSGNYKKKSRIFSLRGCHLIAMFARTDVAKEFRKWVLDVLEKEVLKQQIDTRVKINAQQQTELKEIVDRRCEGSVKKRTELWSRHNQHFRIPRYSELLAIHFSDAVTFLETMKLRTVDQEANIRDLALHMLWLNHWWDEFGDSIRKLSPKMGHGIHDHFKFGAHEARLFLGKATYMPIFELAQSHDWYRSGMDYKTLKEVARLQVTN
jgi:prophage antirepressor-like protein